MKTFFELVGKICKEKDVSTTQFCKDVKISLYMFYSWKRNPKSIPNEETVNRIIDVYSLNSHYFDNIRLRDSKATKQEVFKLFEKYASTKSCKWLSEHTLWTLKELNDAYDDYLAECRKRRKCNERIY